MNCRCETCGAVFNCPGTGFYAASPTEVGLPADWEPPLIRGGPRHLDVGAMPHVPYDVVDAIQSRRIALHGGRTWWCGHCRYVVFPMRLNQCLSIRKGKKK